MRLSEALRYRAAIEKFSAAIPDEELLEVPKLALVWDGTSDYRIGDRVTYEHVLYKCLQEHRAQEGWTPMSSPALWSRVLIPDAGVIPEWVQPESTNGYQKGDKVTHCGLIWVSLLDSNVWEPGIYGWEVSAS